MAGEEDIAEQVGMPQRTVSDVLAKNETFRLPLKPGLLAEVEDAG